MEFEGILRFFENKTILIIGATGFLAKGSLSFTRAPEMHLFMFVQSYIYKQPNKQIACI